VNITLEPAGELPGGRRQWSLTAEVPADTKDARPFNEYDGVVLRIAGKTERFIRIPLEGTISGGR
jgi:hypothetical protein